MLPSLTFKEQDNTKANMHFPIIGSLLRSEQDNTGAAVPSSRGECFSCSKQLGVGNTMQIVPLTSFSQSQQNNTKANVHSYITSLVSIQRAGQHEGNRALF